MDGARLTAHDSDFTIGDVARACRCSTDTVRRHHEQWTKKLGFPGAVSLPGVRGLRWNGVAVQLWRLQRAAAGAVAEGERSATTDWHAVAAARGALLDLGVDPDKVDLHSGSVPTLPASE